MADKANPMKRVLVANRGEIAVRVIQALRELSIESVALYSDADQDSMHVALADYAFRLPGVSPAETYLNVDLILKAIARSRADGVHPGYGFLAEHAGFCAAVEECGATFIGPSSQSIAQMGDKISARRLMDRSGVPVVPGVFEPLASLADLRRSVKDIGFPLMLKASAGGGGRGMRVVRDEASLEDAYNSCRREAQAYFGNDALFCERYIETPRHIEFQVMCDTHGNAVHLFERDCSVQRRHQKLFEEAPSVYLNSEQRARLGEYALSAARAVEYRGAGTVEFICESPDTAYFMEMNTRIQVEHPVTEWITGVDLIAEQIRVAQGERLSFQQSEMGIHGYALEARINAEDPARGFVPSSGRIARLRWPGGPFVRVDTHLYPGYELPESYDSLLAKLTVWGRTRTEALERMRRALAEVEIQGVATTVRFHEALLQQPDFRSGNYSTRILEDAEEHFRQALSEGRFSGVARDHFGAALGYLASRGERSPQKRVGNVEQSLWRASSKSWNT